MPSRGLLTREKNCAMHSKAHRLAVQTSNTSGKEPHDEGPTSSAYEGSSPHKQTAKTMGTCNRPWRFRSSFARTGRRADSVPAISKAGRQKATCSADVAKTYAIGEYIPFFTC